jgi:hypothetical protein
LSAVIYPKAIGLRKLLGIYAKHINASLWKNASKLPFSPSLAFITTALEENDKKSF